MRIHSPRDFSLALHAASSRQYTRFCALHISWGSSWYVSHSKLFAGHMLMPRASRYYISCWKLHQEISMEILRQYRVTSSFLEQHYEIFGNTAPSTLPPRSTNSPSSSQFTLCSAYSIFPRFTFGWYIYMAPTNWTRYYVSLYYTVIVTPDMFLLHSLHSGNVELIFL